MRFRPNAVLVLCVACATLSANAQHGIDVADIRKDGAPCNDFFDCAWFDGSPPPPPSPDAPTRN